MKNLVGLIRVLIVALAIPGLGFAVSYFIINDMGTELRAEGIPGVIFFCDMVSSGELGRDAIAEFSAACQQVSHIELLGQVSIAAALIGILIPVLYGVASLYAGENRARMASIFPLALRFSLVLIAASVLIQGAILTYAVYVGESYVIQQVHVFIIGAIGLGALFGGLKLVGVSFAMGKKLKMNVLGKQLSAQESPKLFSFVKSLSESLGAKAPENIIVGLEPTFYVTSSDIQVVGREKEVKGETLYISAPLARLLTKEEFASVLGHELGHFRGDDTVYSMRFAPVYAGLGMAIEAIDMEENEGASSIARLPAIIMLSYMFDLFATNAAKISRDREFEADKAGAEAGSSLDFSTALIKVSLFSGLWADVFNQDTEQLSQGKAVNNLSTVFQDKVTSEFDLEHIDTWLQPALDETISHPTDSHPPISSRLDKLGVDSTSIATDITLTPEHSAVELIDSYSDIETEITSLEHEALITYGVVRAPSA